MVHQKVPTTTPSYGGLAELAKHPSRKRADLRVLRVRIPHPPLVAGNGARGVGRVVECTAVLTRQAQEASEVRILHPPLGWQRGCGVLFDKSMANVVAIAQRNERSAVNRKVMGSTPIGGVTSNRSYVDLAQR